VVFIGSDRYLFGRLNSWGRTWASYVISAVQHNSKMNTSMIACMNISVNLHSVSNLDSVTKI